MSNPTKVVVFLRSLADMIEADPECLVDEMLITYYPNFQIRTTLDGHQYIENPPISIGKIEIKWNVSKVGWPMY